MVTDVTEVTVPMTVKIMTTAAMAAPAVASDEGLPPLVQAPLCRPSLTPLAVAFLLKSPRRAPWRVPRQVPVKLQHRAPVKRLPRAPAKHLHPRAKEKGGQVMEMGVLKVGMEEGLLPTCGTIAPLPRRCTACSSKSWDLAR